MRQDNRIRRGARHWIFAGILLAAHPVSAEQCRQALALGLDVSGSVDAREYRLQLDGLASALGARSIKNALFAMPSAPIHIMVYEWSGDLRPHILLDWTAVRSEEDLDDIQTQLRSTQRRHASPGTALGQAMVKGFEFLQARDFCWKQTLDISGDGKSNLGPDPISVKPLFEQNGITLNALVIGADAPGLGDLRQAEIGELSAYFNANVIVGENAFVQAALDYANYEEAMTRKLEKELEGLVVSQLVPE